MVCQLNLTLVSTRARESTNNTTTTSTLLVTYKTGHVHDMLRITSFRKRYWISNYFNSDVKVKKKNNKHLASFQKPSKEHFALDVDIFLHLTSSSLFPLRPAERGEQQFAAWDCQLCAVQSEADPPENHVLCLHRPHVTDRWEPRIPLYVTGIHQSAFHSCHTNIRPLPGRGWCLPAGAFQKNTCEM